MNDIPVLDNIMERPQALFDFFERMPRQGPGCPDLTRSLLEKFRCLLPSNPVAADMGCGNGAAALILAEKGISVTGVDIHQPFMDDMMRQASENGLSHLVKCHQSSMTETGFADNSLDLIWSEGATFTVGFENALKAFWPMLKSGGVIGVSDCSWFTKKVPEEVREQWKKWDTNLKTVSENLKIAEDIGYTFLHSERLTAEMWEESFFRPIEKVIDNIREDSSSPPDLLQMADFHCHETEFFRKYNRFYGYVFHVLQKP